MGGHDRLFKELIQEFFPDLIRLILPHWRDRLRPEAAELVRDEAFLDLPFGQRRQMDLLARVPTRRGPPELVLVHVEIEARHRRDLGRRMWRYSMAIRQRHDRPVIPLVVQLTGGRPGVREHHHRETLFDSELLRFRYWRLALEPCRPEDYLQRSEPLAWAFSALMRGGDLRPAPHKFAIMDRLARAPIDDARRSLLAICTETYLQLDPNDREELATMMRHSGGKSMLETYESSLSWADRIKAEAQEEGWRKGEREGRKEGRREGRREGRKEGRKEGRREGRHRGMAEVLLRQLSHRFGPLPDSLEDHLLQLESDELQRLAARLLEASSLDDLGLA